MCTNDVDEHEPRHHERLLFPVRAIGNNLGKSSAQCHAIMAAENEEDAWNSPYVSGFIWHVSDLLLPSILPQFLLSALPTKGRKLIVRVAPNHHIDGLRNVQNS